VDPPHEGEHDVACRPGDSPWAAGDGEPYEVYTLATELLLRGRNPTLVFAYYEAIGRGVAWRDAFASTFGRSIDAFVTEFEAYRRTL
jgi:hypothetical protein